MPYPRTTPVTEKQLFDDEYPGHHTICQTIRDTYRLTDDEKVKENLRLIFAFGKRMHNKLKEYRQRYDDEEKNRKYEEEI